MTTVYFGVVVYFWTGHVQLMKKYYKTNSWASYNLPRVLKERGVDDEAKLPNFHYRQDALKLWAAIEEFVKAILDVYYHSDDQIIKVLFIRSF